MNTQSEDQAELFAALATAQGVMEAPKSIAKNPYFKSQYAPLSECIRVSRGPLSENGLCVIQESTLDNEGGVTIRTTLAHSSGQWRASELTLKPDKAGPQALGVVITYGRRYGYCAMIGLAQEDEDAGEPAEQPKPEVSPANVDWLKKRWWHEFKSDHEGADKVAAAEAFAEWVHNYTGKWPRDGWTTEMADKCKEILGTLADMSDRLNESADDQAAKAAAKTVAEQTPTVESWEALFATCQTPDAVRSLQISSTEANPDDEAAIGYAAKHRIKELA